MQSPQERQSMVSKPRDRRMLGQRSHRGRKRGQRNSHSGDWRALWTNRGTLSPYAERVRKPGSQEKRVPLALLRAGCSVIGSYSGVMAVNQVGNGSGVQQGRL